MEEAHTLHKLNDSPEVGYYYKSHTDANDAQKYGLSVASYGMSAAINFFNPTAPVMTSTDPVDPTKNVYDSDVWKAFSPTTLCNTADCSSSADDPFYNDYGLKFGAYGSFTSDVLSPEYSVPFYWMYRNNENFLVMNPRVWLNSAHASARGALFLMPIEAWFEISFTPM